MNTEEPKKKKKNSITRIIRGEFFAEDYVTNQFRFIAFVTLLLIVFISNGYYCMQQLSDIEDLKIQLKDIQYENLVISTDLTSHSRQSQVEELLEKKGIELSTSPAPAFEIYK
jgi:hypothetical protein